MTTCTTHRARIDLGNDNDEQVCRYCQAEMPPCPCHDQGPGRDRYTVWASYHTESKDSFKLDDMRCVAWLPTMVSAAQYAIELIERAEATLAWCEDEHAEKFRHWTWLHPGNHAFGHVTLKGSARDKWLHKRVKRVALVVEAPPLTLEFPADRTAPNASAPRTPPPSNETTG